MSPTTNCDQAPVLDPGAYTGSLAELQNDFALEEAEGTDGVVAIDVPAGVTLHIRLREAFGDPVLGVFDDCASDPLSVSDAATDELETLTYAAETAERLYVVLDSFQPGCTVILDLAFE